MVHTLYDIYSDEMLGVLLTNYHAAKKAQLDTPSLSDKKLKHLNEVSDYIEKLAKMIAMIIDMLLVKVRSKKDRMQSKAVFSMVDCIQQALDYYPLSETKKNKIHFEKSGDFKVKGEELLVQHIIYNLLKNALYYTHSKGGVFVSLTSDKQANILHFKDTGTGISEEVLSHILKIFILNLLAVPVWDWLFVVK